MDLMDRQMEYLALARDLEFPVPQILISARCAMDDQVNSFDCLTSVLTGRISDILPDGRIHM